MLRDRRVLESEWYATDVITLTLMLKTGDNLNAITAFDTALLKYLLKMPVLSY